MEETEEQLQNSEEHHLKPWQFKKGQSGNPAGRPPGKSLKERAKVMLSNMSPEEEQEFLEGIDKKIIWEMAEGKPKQDMEIAGTLTISQVLNELENGSKTSKQGMEDKTSL